MSLLHYLAWSSKTSDEAFRTYHERSSLDLGMVDADGRSMLHLAAQRGNVPVIEYLVHTAEDFNMNQRDRRGRTVLHHAVENKRPCDTLTALMSHRASIWARDCHEQSALHHAVKVENLPAVKALLALGMVDELHAADCFGMTPLKIAAHHKAQAVLKFLGEMEGHSEWDKHLTEPSLVGYRDLPIAETDGLFRTSLSTPAQTRYGALTMRPRQGYHWIEGGWKSLSRTLRRHRCHVGDLKAC